MVVRCCTRGRVLGDYELVVTHEYNPPMSAWPHRYHSFELELIDRRTHDVVGRACANGSAYAFASMRRRLVKHAEESGGRVGRLRSDHWQLTATDVEIQKRDRGAWRRG